MITIELPTVDEDVIKELTETHTSNVTVVHLKKFHGPADLTQVLIALTPLLIPVIAKIVIEQIRSRKYIVVKHKDTVVQGISEQNITQVLEQLLADQEPSSDADKIAKHP